MDHIKKCCRCEETKDADEFSWDKTREIYVAACRACQRKRQQEHRDAKKKLHDKECKQCGGKK